MSQKEVTSKIPILRFQEFQGEWEEKKLGNLMEFKNGINADKEKYGAGFPFINVLDILNNDYIYHNLIIGKVNVDESIAKKSIVTYGDVLFQRSSETKEEVGSANVYLDKDHNATFGGFVIRGKKIGEYDPIFINKLLKTKSARNNITSKSGGSTRYNIGQGSLSGIELFFPSLLEQEKIGTFLFILDEKIEKLKLNKSLLEQYKKGVMQKIFSREMRFRDENGEEFGEWDEKRLGEVVKFSKGKGISKSDIEDNGIIECIRYGELYTTYRETISFVKSRTNINIKDLVLSEGNDVIIPASGETEIDIATASCVLRPGIALGGDLNILKTKINGVFLSYYLNNAKKKEIANMAQGIAVVHLYASQLKDLNIDVPSLPEQQKIASFLSEIDKKIDAITTEIRSTEKWKKGLLQGMFI